MERIGIVGLSLQETDIAGLECLARPEPARFDSFAREFADELGASELVLLLTCNRVEVVFAREAGHLPSSADRLVVAQKLGLDPGDELVERLHLHTGRDAARHLFRVASSLESVVLGENQILAQVRDAFKHSEQLGLIGRLLGTLFEHAFQVGKQVRTQTDLSRNPVSVVSLGVGEILARYPDRSARVALVGAGAMAELVIRCAAEHDLKIACIANRSLPKAQGLAKSCGARTVTLAELQGMNGGFDAVIAATSAPGYVLDRATLLRFAASTPSGKRLLAVDLAVPRDVEPTQDPRVEIIDLEALRAAAAHNRSLRATAAAQAEAIVEEKLTAFVDRAAQTNLAETLAEVRGESESVFEHELASLFTGKLAKLGDEEKRAIERWARTTFGRVTHVPISAIKRIANDHSLFAGHDGGGERA
jgi:glutamyl-tRNA reductase